MSVLTTEIRSGAYADSVVLMQLQSDLQRLDGVIDAGVVMATEVNLELLRSSHLLDREAESASPNDLVITVRAESSEQATAALAKVETLLGSKRSDTSQSFRPHSLGTALEMVPQGSWTSISTPGRYAGAIALQALDHHCPVFLYSDNVPIEEELELKHKARELGGLIMGPDCGSAMIAGVGFGFVNQLRQGPIGLVCASGTGLQAISSQIHRLGSGVSHAIGTGGRDMTDEIGGLTTRAGLDLLARDSATRALVLASKPPGMEVTAEILNAALEIEKPVVVYFSGFPAPAPRVANVHFARSLTEAAEIAVGLMERGSGSVSSITGDLAARPSRYFRGLFSGGTMALETLQGIGPFLSPVYSNLGASDARPLSDPTQSQGHTVLDLGADEYTVGRLHPMMDSHLRNERLFKEAADPDTGLIMLDVILGRGSHPNPGEDLAPVLSEIRAQKGPRCMALVVGTDEDSQDREATVGQLEKAGATVASSLAEALPDIVRYCGKVPEPVTPTPPIELLATPQHVVNVGLEIFYDELIDQEVATVQVNWRPPAGGNPRLMSILERMKS